MRTKVSMFGICVLSLMVMPVPAIAEEYVCRTDYRNSGLSAEEIARLCAEEAKEGQPSNDVDNGDGNTYPSTPTCGKYFAGKCTPGGDGKGKHPV